MHTTIPKSRKKALFIYFIAVLLIDAATKYYAFNFLSSMDWLHPVFPYGGVGVFENIGGISFSLNYVENRGGAFGMFAEGHEILLAIRIVIIISLAAYISFINKEPSRRLSLVSILAGAIGNVIDCFTYGHVVDMFHFIFWGHSFAVFNIADVAISLGVGLMIVQMLLANKRSGSSQQFNLGNSNFMNR